MRWRIALGLALVFTGTGNISMGVTFGFLRFIDYLSAPGLAIVVYLSVIGVLTLFLGKRAIARYPEYDLGPQICLMALLGIVVGIVTACCGVLLPQYGAVCVFGQHVLVLTVLFWITMLVRHFKDDSSVVEKTQK